MTRSRKLITGLLAAAILFAGGCKKYPDGPVLSLRTKKARIVGEWQLDQVIKNGTDSSDYYKAYLGSNYKLLIKAHYVYWVLGNFPGDGTWRFDDEKEKIYFQPIDKREPEIEYEIRRLKSRQLWLRHTDSKGRITESRYFQ
jgi:hypothetical protein